jgi:small neutral amino acid transporter SnatA (MarC family)
VSIASAAILLLLVMDPLGNIPFFLAALKPVAPARQVRVVVRELLIAYGVMVVFLFAGGPLFAVLGISEPALTIAGGVILFLIALRMVFPPPWAGDRRFCLCWEGSAGEWLLIEDKETTERGRADAHAEQGAGK